MNILIDITMILQLQFDFMATKNSNYYYWNNIAMFTQPKRLQGESS